MSTWPDETLVLFQGGMVMKDQPFSIDSFPYEREIAADRFVSFQFPIPQHQDCIGPKFLRLQICKDKFAHRLTIWVFGFVTLESTLPAAFGLPTRTKSQARIVPVWRHKVREVPAIPSLRLLFYDFFEVRSHSL